MAISYYCGNPGAGKSYAVVMRVIAPALKSGRKVVTNIPMTQLAKDMATIHGGELIQFNRGQHDMLSISSMLLGDKSEATGDYVPNNDYAGAVFVLDEFSMLLPSGTKPSAIDDKIKAFFAMHRHVSGNGYSTEIVILSQNAGQIAQYVKSMIDQTFVISKSKIGKKSIMTISIYSGCYSGRSSKDVLLVKKETHGYDKEIFDYYKSQTFSESGEVENEAVTDDATNILKHPALKMALAGLILFPVLVYFAYINFMGVFDDGSSKTADVVSAVSGVPADPAAGADPSLTNKGADPAATHAPDSIAVSASASVAIPDKPVIPQGAAWLGGLSLSYVGRYTDSGGDVLILMMDDGQGGVTRVTSKQLLTLGVPVMMREGLPYMSLADGFVMIPPHRKNDVPKPFFGSDVKGG